HSDPNLLKKETQTMSVPTAMLISELSKTILTRRTADPRRSAAPTALIFSFPFPGPWGKALTEHAQALAGDMAKEPGLVWKLWLENRKSGRAGGIYLFKDAASAERYRDKHEHRLAAMGLTGVTATAFQVNTELSGLTKACGALGLGAKPAKAV